MEDILKRILERKGYWPVMEVSYILENSKLTVNFETYKNDEVGVERMLPETYELTIFDLFNYISDKLEDLQQSKQNVYE